MAKLEPRFNQFRRCYHVCSFTSQVRIGTGEKSYMERRIEIWRQCFNYVQFGKTFGTFLNNRTQPLKRSSSVFLKMSAAIWALGFSSDPWVYVLGLGGERDTVTLSPSPTILPGALTKLPSPLRHWLNHRDKRDFPFPSSFSSAGLNLAGLRIFKDL